MPYPVIEAVTTAVDEAERTLGRSLGRRLPLAIIDHVQYVLERMQKGIRIPSAAMPELRVLHPQEFDAATAMARSVSASLQTELPEEEAVFLTMHILNATRDEPNGTAALLFRRVQHVVTTVERGLGRAAGCGEPGLRAVHPAHPVPAAAAGGAVDAARLRHVVLRVRQAQLPALLRASRPT